MQVRQYRNLLLLYLLLHNRKSEKHMTNTSALTAPFILNFQSLVTKQLRVAWHEARQRAQINVVKHRMIRSATCGALSYQNLGAGFAKNDPIPRRLRSIPDCNRNSDRLSVQKSADCCDGEKTIGGLQKFARNRRGIVRDPFTDWAIDRLKA